MSLPAPEPIFLVQDNCPAHKANIADQWFRDHPECVRPFWPAKSPDLNPIEHLWGIMVSEWEEWNERSAANLRRHCQSVCENLRRNQCMLEALLRSMPRRIAAVREANGLNVKY